VGCAGMMLFVDAVVRLLLCLAPSQRHRRGNDASVWGSGLVVYWFAAGGDGEALLDVRIVPRLVMIAGAREFVHSLGTP
jgi:hypothetical protein